jgi:uncharacterized phage infection (PIP) family protein YhgE
MARERIKPKRKTPEQYEAVLEAARRRVHAATIQAIRAYVERGEVDKKMNRNDYFTAFSMIKSGIKTSRSLDEQLDYEDTLIDFYRKNEAYDVAIDEASELAKKLHSLAERKEAEGKPNESIRQLYKQSKHYKTIATEIEQERNNRIS